MPVMHMGACMTDNGEQKVTLTDEEGNENDFYVIGDLEVEGKTYIALEPIENEDDEYVILRIEIDENGDETLVTIDDDDEFDRAADAFEDEFMDEIDLDDEYGEEDEGDPEEDE